MIYDEANQVKRAFIELNNGEIVEAAVDMEKQNLINMYVQNNKLLNQVIDSIESIKIWLFISIGFILFVSIIMAIALSHK